MELLRSNTPDFWDLFALILLFQLSMLLTRPSEPSCTSRWRQRILTVKHHFCQRSRSKTLFEGEYHLCLHQSKLLFFFALLLFHSISYFLCSQQLILYFPSIYRSRLLVKSPVSMQLTFVLFFLWSCELYLVLFAAITCYNWVLWGLMDWNGIVLCSSLYCLLIASQVW